MSRPALPAAPSPTRSARSTSCWTTSCRSVRRRWRSSGGSRRGCRRRRRRRRAGRARRAALIALPLAACAALVLVLRPRLEARDPLVAEAIADHLRVVYREQPVDIESGGPHRVKPWFTGRLDFAVPQVYGGDQEFTLIGGAVALFQDRKAALLVYKRQLHTISLFVFPGRRADPAERSAPASVAGVLRRSVAAGRSRLRADLRPQRRRSADAGAKNCRPAVAVSDREIDFSADRGYFPHEEHSLVLASPWSRWPVGNRERRRTALAAPAAGGGAGTTGGRGIGGAAGFGRRYRRRRRGAAAERVAPRAELGGSGRRSRRRRHARPRTAASTPRLGCTTGETRCDSSGRRLRCTSDGSWADDNYVCTVALSGSSDYNTMCALKADGRLACWASGDWANGQAAMMVTLRARRQRGSRSASPTTRSRSAPSAAAGTISCWRRQGGALRVRASPRERS